ncbi:MAG: FtsW/RodA/SpoVE family cell cycle protein [Planctomycetota bacterium]
MLTRRDAIALAALALLTIGVIMVNSAGMRIVPVDAALNSAAEPAVTVSSILLSRTAMYAVAAVAAMFVVSRFSPRWLDRAARLPGAVPLVLFALSVLFMLVLLSAVYWPGIGKEVNGANRWVRVPVIQQFQPSEVVKWLVLPALAVAAVATGPRIRNTLTGAMPLLLAVAAIAGAIVLEDLGTAVLVAGVGVMLVLAAGMRFWSIALLGPVAGAGFGLAVLSSPYRVDRVVSFIDPFRDASGDGYHMIQSMATIAGGGPFGRGLGHGLQKFGYLPEDTTDFVFAVICEELGLTGALMVLAIYAALFVALAAVARAAQSPTHRLVVLGVLLTLVGQTVINLFVVTGLGPTKGIALPLLSAGGTGWILIGAVLGMVISIDRAGTEQARPETTSDADRADHQAETPNDELAPA